MIEINFDGLIGPSHNYAALSPGNLASAANAGAVSRPRDAALQGLAKMRAALDLGLAQGLFVPHDRPATGWLRALGFAGDDDAVAAAAVADPVLFAHAMSASAMWTRERRHRLARRRLRRRPLPPDRRQSQRHAPSQPRGGGDAGAAAPRLRRPGLRRSSTRPDVRRRGRGQPHADRAGAGGRAGSRSSSTASTAAASPRARAASASEAVARAHGLAPARTLFVEQSPAAIAAGAFHNDVVAVADGALVFAHEAAFAGDFAADLARAAPWAELIVVPASAVSLARGDRLVPVQLAAGDPARRHPWL